MTASAPLLALSAALAFALASIFLKRALQYSRPLTAAVVSVTFTAGFVWVAAALTRPMSGLLTRQIVPFLVAGLMAPGLARLAYYTGVDRIGVARSTPLISTAPLFAVAMAMIVLGERPGWSALLGAACVVAGAALLSQRERGDVQWRRRDLAFPLLAALGFALRDVISRAGLRQFPEPLVAAAGATFASVVVMWLYALSPASPKLGVATAGLWLLVAGGLCEGVAYLTMWRALALGDVTLVSPLVHAQPFFTVVLAALFLRDLEHVTWRISTAAALIVLGVLFVIRAQ